MQRTYTVLKVFPIDPDLKIRGPPAAYQYVTDLPCFFDGEVGDQVEELAGKILSNVFTASDGILWILPDVRVHNTIS